jgi:hypothetical protein
MDPSSAHAQFTHALAAATAGLEPEAVAAMERARDAGASWERTRLLDRLDQLARARPALDLTTMRRALSDEPGI